MTQVLRLSLRQGIAYLMLFGGNLVLFVAIGSWSLATQAPVFGIWQWPKLPGIVIAIFLLPVLFAFYRGFGRDTEKEAAVSWLVWTFIPCFSVAWFLALGAWLLPVVISWTWAGVLALGAAICLYEILALILSLPEDY